MYKIKRFSGKYARTHADRITDAIIIEENGKKIPKKLGTKSKVGLGLAAAAAVGLGAKALHTKMKKNRASNEVHVTK